MRRIIQILIPLVVITAVWLIWPFLQSSEQQVTKCHEKFMSLAGQRYWSEAAAFLAPDYLDQWENKPQDAIDLAREAFRGFIVLDLKWQTIEVTVNEPIAKIRGTASIEGNGAGASQLVISQVNKLKEPWVFTWRKDGWKPGDWRLVSVKQEELEGMVLPSL